MPQKLRRRCNELKELAALSASDAALYDYTTKANRNAEEEKNCIPRVGPFSGLALYGAQDGIVRELAP